MGTFETFVNTELPRRSPLLTFANTSYDGDPNDVGAPAIVSGAPLGTWYHRTTGDLFYRKNEAGLYEEAGAGGFPDVTGNDGYAVIELGSVAAFRPIKQAYIVPDFAINSFGVSGAIKEVGESAPTPSFTASYNRTPDVATLTDNQGSPAKDVSSTPTAFQSDGTFSKTTNNATASFYLNASEGVDADSASAVMYWRPRTMYGVDSQAGAYDEAFIEALATQQLDNNRQATFSVNAGAGEYIFYSYPSAYGAGTFFVGGFEGGFSLVGTISVTNSFGVTQDYYLYRSDNPSLGVTTIQVT